MSEIKITKENYEQEVLNSNIPVLIDFWAPWCGPCRMLGPVVEELANEANGEFKVCKVNVDEEPELASEFGVMSIPTVVIMKDKRVVNTAVGFRPKEELLDLLNQE